MSDSLWSNPRTAEPANSIWSDVSEETFRLHLVDLERNSNSVPMGPQIFSISAWKKEGQAPVDSHLLPIEIEHQFADDLAFLAAIEEGAQSVSAVSIEENIDGRGMTVTFAAMDAVKTRHQDAIQGLCNTLTGYATRVPRRGLPQNDYPNTLGELQEKILRTHRNRIVARLRSRKWQKPPYLSESHKKPLWKDFSNLVHRAQFLYEKREARGRWAIEVGMQKLASLYEWFEDADSDPALEIKYLGQIIKESYRLCTSEGMKKYVLKLGSVRATSQVASAMKCVRQIEKIAAYQRLPTSLLDTVEQFKLLFSKIELRFLAPYTSIPASIAYEPWAKTCHVHSEVQLAVYYDSHHDHNKLRPRVIGTSKYMCFLCLLFVKAHGHFFPANTHGRLYDQWTIPDLAEFKSQQIEDYRHIIRVIDSEVIQLATLEPKWRPEPMTSCQDLSKVNGSPAAWTGSGKMCLRPFSYTGHDSDADESAVVLPEEKRTRR